MLGRDVGPHGVERRRDLPAAQNRDVPRPAFIRLERPGVDQAAGLVRAGEHLDRPFPRRLAAEGLMHGLGPLVNAVEPVQVSDHVPHAREVSHAAMSTRSATVRGLLTIPASRAGVQRIER
jgi:hypothetical protein